MLLSVPCHASTTIIQIFNLVGLGFGLMSGAFSLMNVLADALGPGTVGLDGRPQVTCSIK